MNRNQARALWHSGAIGLASVACVLATYLAGGLDWLEARTYDLRVRYSNSIEEHRSPAIVCIDIDNSSIAAIGRWPWDRDEQAPLISIPAELGAMATLVDITWTEKQTIRVDFPGDADVAADPLLVSRGNAERRFPDFELRKAIAGAGNVYLNYDFPPFDLLASEEFGQAVDAVMRGDQPRAEALLGLIQQRRPAEARFEALRPEDQARESRPLDRARIVAALQREPLATEATIAAGLQLTVEFVAQAYRPARLLALQRIVAARLAESAEAASWLPQKLYRSVADSLGDERVTPDSILGQDLAAAIRRQLGERATRARPVAPLSAVESIARRIEGFTPVYFDLAAAARRCGFAVFEPDSDGVVRRMQLFASHGGDALPQMAVALACDLLDVPPEGVRARPGELRLNPRDEGRGERVIQLDRDGAMLIPWVQGDEWIRQFQRIPARNFVEVARNRAADEKLDELARGELSRSIELLPEEGRAAAARALADMDAAQRGLREAVLDQDATQIELFRSAIGELRPELERLEAAITTRLGDASVDGKASEAGERLRTLQTLRRQQERIRADVAEQLDTLRRRIEGNICLIGYTATSLADMKPTPTGNSVPGVMAHASLVNALLSNRFVRRPPAVVDGLLTVLMGCVAIASSVLLRPRLAFQLILFLAVAYVLIAGVITFHRWTTWMALTPVLSALIVPVFLISLYRYVFIDSERRQLSTALSQYTSKEIARQMAENPELCKRAESREVTSMFTDLRGFTTISERVGAERTQKLLNVCLGRFTEAMLVHEAMVNKFIGDGIFAFWNPVIFPQPDHARRACLTAIDLLRELDKLKLERPGGDEIYDELYLRIGVATGNAIVGPCGSEQKFDYTCIGDSVNLAARLESANKFFGTQILVAGTARDQVGDEFAFRRLGGVQVKGKRGAVPVFELLGRSGEVAESLLTYAARFDQAVTALGRRDWTGCIAILEDCLKLRPDDTAAQRFLEAARGYQAEPPPADWNGAIELSEK